MGKNIVVSIPNRSSSSQINAELTKLLNRLGRSDETLPETGDFDNVSFNFSYMQPIDANRNKMVKEFLQDEENEWLLMIDNDVVPPQNILEMIDFGEKVVSATVTIKKNSVPQPVIVRQRDDGEYREVGLQEYHDELDKETGLIEVDSVGTGCLLVHRSVLEEMKPPWFKFQYNEDGTLRLGEDFYFGRRLQEKGVPMYVSTNHVCSHYRKTDLTEFAHLVNWDDGE